MKHIYIFLIIFAGILNINAELITWQKFENFGLGRGFCFYVGKLDKMMRYHKNQPGTFIDDGLFVAVPNGGPYNGYSYYEIEYNLNGAKDGSKAYLPRDPAQFINFFPIHVYDRDIPGGYISTWGRGNRSISETHSNPEGVLLGLPDGCILPPGSLFFFWISGGGEYSLGFNTLDELPFSHKVVRAKTVPLSIEEHLWFEESETVEATYKVYQIPKHEYENQWRSYFNNTNK